MKTKVKYAHCCTHEPEATAKTVVYNIAVN